MKKSVLITHDLPEVAPRILRRRFRVVWNKHPLSGAALMRRIRPHHGLVCALADPVTAQGIRAGKRLEGIAVNAAGVNHIALEEARRRGIPVSNTPDVLTDATADLAFALILAALRRIPEGEALVRSGRFRGWGAKLLLGRELKGKTLGLYGFGRIGRAVAERAKGWHLKVLYHGRRRLPRSEERRLGVRYASFPRLLAESDVLSVHAPLTPRTRHRFTRREFARMKPTAVFVNTGRGPIHRERDLAWALRTGRLLAAGLDVYEFEPHVDPGLRRLPNCVLLPHVGSATWEAREAMARLATENLVRMLSGKPPLTPVP